MNSIPSTPFRSAGSGAEAEPERPRPGTEGNQPGAGQVKELAFRENDGLEITLLWYANDDRLAVSVYDIRSGELLDVPAPRERALDAFYHPFAYAARRGIDYDAPATEGAIVDSP